MEPPQLRCAEAPMRTSLGAPVPMFVDESVGDIWVQECQELGGASRRKRRVHGPANYSLKLYLSAKSGEQHISRTTCLLHITYTETRNTLSERRGRRHSHRALQRQLLKKECRCPDPRWYASLHCPVG